MLRNGLLEGTHLHTKTYQSAILLVVPQAEYKHATDAKSALEQQLHSVQLRLDKAEATRQHQLAQLEALQEQLDVAQAAGSEHDGAARAAGEREAAAVDAAEMLRAQLAAARDQLAAKEQLLAVRWGRGGSVGGTLCVYWYYY